MQKLKLEFVGIDDWNRPIFKVPNYKIYFGSTDFLVNYQEVENGIFEKLELEDLCYFGSSFNCEPLGGLYLTKDKVITLKNGEEINVFLEGDYRPIKEGVS